MCTVDAAALIVALVGTTVSIVQADRAQEEAEEFRMRKEAQERRNALAAHRIATAEIHEQQVLDHESAALEIQTNARAADQAVARATVTAGEIGAFGLSFQGLVGDFERQESEFASAVQENLAIKNQFAELNLQSAELGKQSRFINASLLPVPKPNYFGYALNGLNDFFQLRKSFGSLKQAG
jgi:hypothetical protein